MDASFQTHFSSLPDPRIERTKRYPLIEILFLVVSATISGSEGWKAIKDFGDIKLSWLRQFLPYEAGIPVDDTIARVMRRLDTKEFQSCFVSWMQAISSATSGDVIAIDGKTLRRSHDGRTNKSPIHMVSAWSTANSVVLGQEKTTDKSNEITAIPELLEVLALKGCIVTIDAMGCQREIASKIVSKKADYVLALKGNQGHFHEETKTFFTTAIEAGFKEVEHDFHEEYDSGHGRLEHRQCWVINPKQFPGSFNHIEKWARLECLVMVKTRREMPDKTTEDTRFYIASINNGAKKLLNIVRKHWLVENALHWTLDVTFREDESRIRKDAAPENYAIVRHMALNVIKSDSSIKASVKRKRAMAALSDDFRTTVVQQAFNLRN